MYTTILLLTYFIGVSMEYRDYTNYSAWSINTSNRDVIHRLHDTEGVTVLSVTSQVGVLVAPKVQHKLKQTLHQYDVAYDVTTDNIQEEINKERSQVRAKRSTSFTFNSYHEYDEMVDYLEELSRDYPHYCTLLTIGHSYENRSLVLIQIGDGPHAVWVDGGVHAREWIAPATAMYIADKLVKSLHDAPHHPLSSLKWYIMPMVNPDGYQYSYHKDRFWRKTRSQHPGMAPYYGVDVNRNWDYQWMMGDASSNLSSSEIYAGPEPHSEPEVKAIAEFLLNNTDIEVYISLHSYGQMWLHAWWSADQSKSDIEEQYVLGLKATQAINRTSGKLYILGAPGKLVYAASGCSQDWAMAVAGIQYAYTVELRPTWELGAHGMMGFMLSPSEIVETGNEMFAAVLEVSYHIHNKWSDGPELSPHTDWIYRQNAANCISLCNRLTIIVLLLQIYKNILNTYS